jgi:hypothetical protein
MASNKLLRSNLTVQGGTTSARSSPGPFDRCVRPRCQAANEVFPNVRRRLMKKIGKGPNDFSTANRARDRGGARAKVIFQSPPLRCGFCRRVGEGPILQPRRATIASIAPAPHPPDRRRHHGEGQAAISHAAYQAGVGHVAGSSSQATDIASFAYSCFRREPATSTKITVSEREADATGLSIGGFSPIGDEQGAARSFAGIMAKAPARAW